MPIAQHPVGFDIDIADPVQRVQKFIDNYASLQDYNGLDATLMRHIRVISAERAPSEGPGRESWRARAVFELDVVPELCNPMGNMHGGGVALAADMTTTMAAAPASLKGFWEFGGVSRSLGVTYLAPIPSGSVVEVECKLLSAGKRLAFLHCEFRDKTSRALLAVAEHGKVAVPFGGSGEAKNPKL